jgi:hypothetical protein
LNVTRLTPVLAWMLASVLGIAVPASGLPQDPPAPAESGGEGEQQPTAADVSPEVADLLAHVYHPVRAGLRDMTFTFRHQAFENAAYPFRKTRFLFTFKAPDHWKLDVRDLHEAHELMGPRLVELMSWIRHFVGGVEVLDSGLVPERIVSATREGRFLKVITRPGEDEIPLTLRFREDEGRYYLQMVQSQKYGTLRLEWQKVGEVEVVTSLEINQPKTALGTWTLRCEDLKVNEGVPDSVFEQK